MANWRNALTEEVESLDGVEDAYLKDGGRYDTLVIRRKEEPPPEVSGAPSGVYRIMRDHGYQPISGGRSLEKLRIEIKD